LFLSKRKIPYRKGKRLFWFLYYIQNKPSSLLKFPEMNVVYMIISKKRRYNSDVCTEKIINQSWPVAAI
jgi:hypothetical protein